MRATLTCVFAFLTISTANAAEVDARFAVKVCDAWQQGKASALEMLALNGWSDGGFPPETSSHTPTPSSNQVEWRQSYQLKSSAIHPPAGGPGSAVRPQVTLEETNFGDHRVAACEVNITTKGEPFATAEESVKLLGAQRFAGDVRDEGPSGMEIRRTSRTDSGGASWATVRISRLLAFPDNVTWRLRISSALQKPRS